LAQLILPKKLEDMMPGDELRRRTDEIYKNVLIGSKRGYSEEKFFHDVVRLLGELIVRNKKA